MNNILNFNDFVFEEYRPFTKSYDLGELKPIGRGGNLKGEDEMVRRGYEYLKELRSKFKYTKYLSFRKLKTIELAKKHELNYNFARIINSHELIEKKRIYSLKFPDTEPTIDDVRNMFREYREYDRSTHKKVSEMTPDEIEKRKEYRKSHLPQHLERKKQLRQLKKFLGIPNEENIKKEEISKEEKEKMFIEEITKISKDPGFKSFCLRLDPKNYDDIMQDSLEAAIKQKDTFVPKSSKEDLKPASIRTWLYSIARNKSLQSFKRTTTRKDIPTSDFNDADFYNMYQETEYEEKDKKTSEVIEKCFDEIPASLQEMLKMAMEETSYKDIANILNDKYGKNYDEEYIKSRIYTGRKILADKIHKILPNLIIKGKTGIEK